MVSIAVYLMILSIILGGFLYFLNIEAGYEHVGLIFYKTGKTLDIFILLLLSILVLLISNIFLFILTPLNIVYKL